MKPIYLDHHATTPLDPRVFEAMMPLLTEEFGNASSRFHPYGLEARNRVEAAREHVAALLGAEPAEVIFTSGATESNNLALFGVARAMSERGRHLISCATEHHAVIDPLMALAREGYEITILPVDVEGAVDLDRLREEIRDDTVLISFMAGNNEIGTLHPIEEIGAIAREKGVFFHCDAVQVAGKSPIDVNRWQADLVSLSAHKFNGPKGVGALYLRRRRPRVHLQPAILGGGQELGLRAGTYNSPGIVGMGEAARLAILEMDERAERTRALRDRLWAGVCEAIPEVYLNGPADWDRRLDGNLNIQFRYCEAQSILMALADEIACSPGSACTNDNNEPSYVLLALGLSREEAVASLRFGLSHTNTEDEIDRVPKLLAGAVERLRSMSPVWQSEFV